MKKKLLLVIHFLTYFAGVAYGSDRKSWMSSHNNYSYSRHYNKKNDTIGIQIAGHILMDYGWKRFCKFKPNRKFFKDVAIPEGQNIFRPARTTGDILDAPYLQTDRPYDKDTEDIRAGITKLVLNGRDKALFYSGKCWKKEKYATSISSLLLATATEFGILQKKKLSSLFEVDPYYVKKEKKDAYDNYIVKKYSGLIDHTGILSNKTADSKNQNHHAINLLNQKVSSLL